MTFTKSNLTVASTRKVQGEKHQRNNRWAVRVGLFDGWEG
jgi:hypothetical protein